MGFSPSTPAQYDRGEPATMMGPNSSGRIAATSITDQPPWQLPMTQGLPSACGMHLDDAFQEHRLGVHDVFDGLARHRLGRETDEVAGMAGMHGHADFAVGLEAADARPVPGARIDHHERPLHRIDHHALRRLDAHEQIVDRLVESAGVQHQFGVEAQHMRHVLALLLVVLGAALAHHVPEQNGALRGIGHVLAKRPPGLQGGVQARHGGHRWQGVRRSDWRARCVSWCWLCWTCRLLSDVGSSPQSAGLEAAAAAAESGYVVNVSRPLRYAMMCTPPST